MINKIFQTILNICVLLSAVIYFLYRGYGWPLGRESLEALSAFFIFLMTTIIFYLYQKKSKLNKNQIIALKIGLIIGILWIFEISMNNLLYPSLPRRDIYDDIFWGIIAIIIFVFSIRQSFISKKIKNGIWSGFWAGIGSGSVASLTALIFIVFGMNYILKDPLNITEWTTIGATSGTPNMAIYFAYQTLAGAVLHLVVLGIVMGTFLGLIGGLVGKAIKVVISKR